MKTINWIIILSLSFIQAQISKAQIVYTDVIPDSIMAGHSSYGLDLNNDSIIDFILTDSTHTVVNTSCTGSRLNHRVWISPVDSTINEVANTLFSTTYYPPVINNDSIIGNAN